MLTLLLLLKHYLTPQPAGSAVAHNVSFFSLSHVAVVPGIQASTNRHEFEFHLEGCPRMHIARSSEGDVDIFTAVPSSASAAAASSLSSTSLKNLISRVTHADAESDTTMLPSLAAAGNKR